MVIYSRDNLAPYLRKLEEMCGAVGLGHFAPDSTRSGMFMGAACSKAGQTEQALLSDSLTEGSEDEENRDLDEEDRATEDMVGDWEPSPGLRASLEGAVLFRHATSRFLHVVSSEEEGSRFLCGRKITSAYQRQGGVPKVLRPICRQCCPT